MEIAAETLFLAREFGEERQNGFRGKDQFGLLEDLTGASAHPAESVTADADDGDFGFIAFHAAMLS